MDIVGLGISIYHYLLQRFPALETGACDPNNPRSAIFVDVFGFNSIPFMAGAGFIVISVLLGLYVNKNSIEEEVTDRLRDGDTWPPEKWLESEGWASPTIKDDRQNSIVNAYGMVATPTYVVLGPDNENLGRVSGEIGLSGLESLARIAADSLDP